MEIIAIVKFKYRYFKVDLTPYPIISRIYGELEKHPSVCATHPSTQLGYPTETDK